MAHIPWGSFNRESRMPFYLYICPFPIAQRIARSCNLWKIRTGKTVAHTKGHTWWYETAH